MSYKTTHFFCETEIFIFTLSHRIHHYPKWMRKH